MNLTIFAVIKAILARLLLFSVSVLSVRSLVQVRDNDLYWFMMSTAILFIFEIIITLTTREGGEWRWFYPSFAIALLSTVPTIWILEVDIMNEHIRIADTLHLNTCVDVPHDDNITSIDAGEVAHSLGFTPEEWSLLLQQILLFTLILVRWMLPKGSLTRDQLSQLLLVYIGIAADILEFSTESLKLEAVRCQETMIITILIIWTWSLLQFTLGLTVTKSRKTRVAGVNDHRDNLNQVCDIGFGCCETETWGIMVTIIMQDGPFFITRIYLIFLADVINQGMIFFTCKNLMVLLLQFYRLLVLHFEKPSQVDVIDETCSETNLKNKPCCSSNKSKNDMSVVEDLKRRSPFSSISTPPRVRQLDGEVNYSADLNISDETSNNTWCIISDYRGNVSARNRNSVNSK